MVFNKWKSLFNKVMTEQQDTNLRETYPANVENTKEFNESSEEELNLEVYDLERLFNDPLVVGWLSEAEQKLLFMLIAFYFRPGESILDIGCGRADLYGFLQNRDSIENINYVGLDYNPNIIEIAKKKYPGVVAIPGDALNLERIEEYDWVVASGAINLKDSDDMFSYSKKLIDVMYHKCKKGVPFNVLNSIPDSASDSDKNALYIHDPAKWLEYLLKTYNKVICRSDYMLGDCTFYIFK
jgi:SAM-dependent methyltransferase